MGLNDRDYMRDRSPAHNQPQRSIRWRGALAKVHFQLWLGWRWLRAKIGPKT